MPSRIVREGINSSPRVNRLSRGAEVLYRRLLSVVDDYGRFHANPITIQGACWPTCPDRVTQEDIIKWLKECVGGEGPLIHFYKVDGSKYLLINNFGQQIRSKSKFPAPPATPDITAREFLDQTKPGTETECDQPEIILSASDEQLLRTSRSRISESNSESLEFWQKDESYKPFVLAWREIAAVTGKPLIEDDFADAYFRWKGLDFEQKLTATKHLHERLQLGVWTKATDPKYIPLPQKYLEKDWKRDVVAPKPRDNGRQADEPYEYKPPPNLMTAERIEAERAAKRQRGEADAATA